MTVHFKVNKKQSTSQHTFRQFKWLSTQNIIYFFFFSLNFYSLHKNEQQSFAIIKMNRADFFSSFFTEKKKHIYCFNVPFVCRAKCDVTYYIRNNVLKISERYTVWSHELNSCTYMVMSQSLGTTTTSTKTANNPTGYIMRNG